MFGRHTLYVFFLAFTALTLRSVFSPYFPFLLVGTAMLGIHYALRFRAKDLFFGCILTGTAVALSFFFSPPGKIPGRITFIAEKGNDERTALLSDGRWIKVSEFAEIGDIVDEEGNVLLKGNSLVYALPRARHVIYTKLKNSMDYPVSSLVGAVTLGIREELPYEIKSYFLLSGLYPFLAISGLHIGIATGIIAFAMKLLKFKKPLTSSSLAVLPFLPLTGMPPSAVRAYVFILLTSLGIENRRKVDPLYITGIVLLSDALLKKPSLSLILSVTAVSGIILSLSGKDGPLKKAVKISIFPFLFTLPVILERFGTVNVLAPLNTVVFSLAFPPFLFLSFLAEATLFKIPAIDKAAELYGLYLLKLSELLFKLTGSFVVHPKIPTPLASVFLLLMLALLLSGRKGTAFALPLALLAYGYLATPPVEGKVIYVEGKKLNSFRFVAGEGQRFKGCVICSDYVFPSTERFLFKDRVIDERSIIRRSKTGEARK